MWAFVDVLLTLSPAWRPFSTESLPGGGWEGVRHGRNMWAAGARQDRGLLALTRRKQRMKEEQRGASRVKVTRHWTLSPVQPDVNLSLQTANIKHLTITTLSFSLGPPQYQYQLTDK